MKVLLVIDIQTGLTKRASLYNRNVFFETVNTTISKYRKLGSLIIFIQHNNKLLQADTNDWKIDNKLNKKDADCVIQKKHGNAFQKTELKALLEENNIKEILICGLTSHGCVKYSCIGAIENGFETSLLRNGHSNLNKDAEMKISATESDLVKLGVKLVDIEEL
ncbi:MAG: isochorismatase family protein [Bacteroidetes bacterium]|nr:isochorismatase family protein [Bacteroidota bacterium]